MKPHTCVWSLVLLAFTSLAPAYAAGAETPKLNHEQLVGSYGKLPLSFEVNQGQTDRRVRFLSHGSGYGFYLTARGAVLALQRSGLQPGKQAQASVLKMELIGANEKAEVIGLGELPAKSNYFIGNDPKKWRTNVPNYAKVRYANVYPGVDLVYYGNQGQLEYDFVVRPGADPRQIALGVEGIRESPRPRHDTPLRVDTDGDLVVRTDGGEVVFHQPVIYQPGPGLGRQRIACCRSPLLTGAWSLSSGGWEPHPIRSRSL